MQCDEAKLKIQALTDDELDIEEIPAVLKHLESCYPCRREYGELLALRKRLSEVPLPEPSEEWFETLERKPLYRLSRKAGLFIFLASYLALLGYAVSDLFLQSSTPTGLKITIAATGISAIILFSNAVYQRLKERKTDRYREVMK